MDNLEKLNKKLLATGLPVAYRAFREEDAPGLPFLCYMSVGETAVHADGVRFYGYERVAVELYTQDREIGTERLVEGALADYRWTKEQEYLSTEGCYVTIYEIEV